MIMASGIIVLCALFLAFQPDLFPPLIVASQHVVHHPSRGYSLVLPLSTPLFNHTLARSRDNRLLLELSRRVSGDAEPNARMTLYDDLLTKGYYTTRLWIGSPPQEFALIVDTGSTVTYVPCLSCTQCGNHQDPRFNTEASSTYKPEQCGPGCASCDVGKQQCKYQRGYAEQSTSKGLLGNDIVSFGSNSTFEPKRLVFGCETAETGDIYAQKADGIMGLGRGHLSIVDQLVAQNAITGSFSLCYGGMDVGGGAMIMGAIPSPPNMTFIRSDFTRSIYYNLALEEVYVGGTQLPLDGRIFDSKFGTILDSGTTFAYFPNKAFEVFKRTLMEHVKLHQVSGPDSRYPDVCFEGAGSDLSKLPDYFPEVQLKFGDGKAISLAPENYLFKHLKVHGGYCLGIFPNDKDSGTLLGGIVVRNMLVTYDRVNKQLGFWRTNCSNLWGSLQKELPNILSTPQMSPSPSPQNTVEPFEASGSPRVSGDVKLTLYLDMNSTAFIGSMGDFLNDLANDLQVATSQVSLMDYSNIDEIISATFSIHLMATNERLLRAQAEDIIARLNTHTRVRDAFGAYRVAKWNMTLLSQRSSHHILAYVLILAVVFVLLLIIGATSVIWWRVRSKASKYVTIPQSVEMSDHV